MRKNKEFIIRTCLIGFLIVTAMVSIITLQILFQMPDIETLNTYVPSESTLIFSADGKVLARLHQEENRQVVPLQKISPYLIKSIITVEDERFYQHRGLDLYGIFRASIKNAIYGRAVEGASTISQQLARNVFLTRRKTIVRKLAEAILALQIERRYTKDEILELYLNQVYWGHNSYGIESAARLYFNKSATDLDLAEASMLAGLIRGPELYSPYRNFKLAKSRQIFVLNKLLSKDIIDERTANLAAIEELSFSPANLKRKGEIAPYFISYILQQLIEKYGEETVYNEGLKVYTSLDSNMQIAAEDVITQYISQEGSRYRFSQSALTSVDPRTGYIKAMVGGADFYQSKFNRAVQAKRPPGSSFKPFVYTAAMEQGISPGTILMDTKTEFQVFPDKDYNPDGTWTPMNFDNKFHGPVTLRYALEKSLNIPSIKLLERVGINSAIDVARRMGIKSHLEPGLSLTLGASEVTLLEMASAFGTFANDGIWVEPVSIVKIENRDGSVIYKNQTNERRALDPNIAAVMVDLMKGVITRGTGIRANIGRPAAAKTGTSQAFRDAWFIGFVPQLTTGVWVGNDDNTSMEGVAEVGVCPRIWKSYNLRVLKDVPVQDFPKPEGLVWVEINSKTGKLASSATPASQRIRETFWRNDVPREYDQTEDELSRQVYEDDRKDQDNDLPIGF